MSNDIHVFVFEDWFFSCVASLQKRICCFKKKGEVFRIIHRQKNEIIFQLIEHR